MDIRDFQEHVRDWTRNTFGDEIAENTLERNHRFLEESLELVQSMGCTKTEALLLVDYVFDREVGDPPQEVGGVMLTLMALCAAAELDASTCGVNELMRATEKADAIRAKRASKPKFSPLPGKAAA